MTIVIEEDDSSPFNVVLDKVNTNVSLGGNTFFGKYTNVVIVVLLATIGFIYVLFTATNDSADKSKEESLTLHNDVPLVVAVIEPDNTNR